MEYDSPHSDGNIHRLYQSSGHYAWNTLEESRGAIADDEYKFFFTHRLPLRMLVLARLLLVSRAATRQQSTKFTHTPTGNCSLARGAARANHSALAAHSTWGRIDGLRIAKVIC